MRSRLLPLAFTFVPAAAHAHGVSPAVSGFYAGAMTVLIGPDDLMEWLALAAFAAVHPPARAGWAAEALALGLVTGFTFGSLGMAGAPPAWTGAAGLLAVGALLAAGVRAPLPALAALAGAIGLSRGLHEGLDMAGRSDTVALAAGIGITAYLLMVICIATLVRLLPFIGPARVVAFRAFGSWVAAIGLMIGAFEVAGR